MFLFLFTFGTKEQVHNTKNLLSTPYCVSLCCYMRNDFYHPSRYIRFLVVLLLLAFGWFFQAKSTHIHAVHKAIDHIQTSNTESPCPCSDHSSPNSDSASPEECDICSFTFCPGLEVVPFYPVAFPLYISSFSFKPVTLLVLEKGYKGSLSLRAPPQTPFYFL